MGPGCTWQVSFLEAKNGGAPAKTPRFERVLISIEFEEPGTRPAVQFRLYL